MGMLGRGRQDPRRALEAASRHSRVGSGEVTFDFRSEELDDGWEIPPFLTQPAPGHPGFYITKPADDEVVSLLGVSFAELERGAVARAELLGHIILQPGDLVRVRAVELSRSNDPLLHPADARPAVVHLERVRGRDVADAGAMYMRRRGALDPNPAADVRTLETFQDRIPNAAPSDQVERVLSLRDEVLEVQAELAKAIREASPTGDDLDPMLPTIWLTLRLERLVNLSARYGYEQGRMEAAASMEKLARDSLDRAEQARELGRRRAIPSRQEFAEAYFAKYPSSSVYAARQAYLAAGYEPGADQKSIDRSFKKFAPPKQPRNQR